MKFKTMAGALLLVSVAAPAAAQTIADDVQCLALSSAFAKGASEVAAKQSAAKALLFYLGRLDHENPQAVKSAMQQLKLDPKAASAGMAACAERLNHAAQAIQALGTPVAPESKPPATNR